LAAFGGKDGRQAHMFLSLMSASEAVSVLIASTFPVCAARCKELCWLLHSSRAFPVCGLNAGMRSRVVHTSSATILHSALLSDSILEANGPLLHVHKEQRSAMESAGTCRHRIQVLNELAKCPVLAVELIQTGSH
jgi:hypothetical protein